MHRILLVASSPFADLVPALLEAGLCGSPTDLVVHPVDAADEPLPWVPDVVLAPFYAMQEGRLCPHTTLRSRYPEAAHIALCTDTETASAALQAGANDALTADETSPAILRRAVPLAVSHRLRTAEPEADFHYRLFNDSPNPMWLYDRTTLRFLLVNRAAERVYGYSRHEFLQHLTVLDIRPPAERDRFLTALPAGFTKGKYYFGTWQHCRRDGSLFFVRIYSQDTRYQGQACRMVLAVDVDKQHAAADNFQLASQLPHQTEQVASLLNSLRDVIWSVDARDGTLRYINQAGSTLLGFENEMLLREGAVADFVHPEDLPRLRTEIRRLIRSGESQTSYRVIARDGTLKYLAGRITLAREGRSFLINGVDSDVTEQHQAALAHLRTTEELYTVLESITDGFITLDLNWSFTYVNREFERVCGMPRQAVLGQNYWQVFPKANGLKFYTEYQRAVRHGVSVHFEEYASSFEAWISVSAYPTATGLTIYFKDITAEKMLRDRIRRDEENLKALIDNTDDLIWSVDRDLHLVSCNQAFRQLFAAQTGHPIRIGDRLPYATPDPETQQQWLLYYNRGLQGETLDFLDLIQRADGQPQFNEVRLRPVTDAAGAILGVSCFSRDVTDQRRRQVAIELQNKRLRQISWIQNHEVRGPLASILGSVAVLSLAEPVELHTREELLAGLRDAAERMDEVIRNIDRMTRTVEPF